MRSPHERRCLPAVALALALALAALSWGAPASAQSVRLLLQSSRLAGFVHDEAAAVFPELRIGDGLQLAREPGNPHDANAVRVEWRGHKLGYVPRAENAALAWAMDRGETLSARVTRLRHHPNPRMRIEFDVYIE
jgi:HIRAN domain-containing protein